MRRERLARGPSTREGANLRGLAARGHSLPGRNLVLGRRRFELLELSICSMSRALRSLRAPNRSRLSFSIISRR